MGWFFLDFWEMMFCPHASYRKEGKTSFAENFLLRGMIDCVSEGEFSKKIRTKVATIMTVKRNQQNLTFKEIYNKVLVGGKNAVAGSRRARRPP